jgi:hypothetical protein
MVPSDLIPKKGERYGVVSYRAFMATMITFCVWQATEILSEIKATAKLANTLDSRLNAQSDRLITLDGRIGRLENPYFEKRTVQ